MNVLVTGGAGYIGSHATRSMLEAGHQVIVLDDLSSGHLEAVHPKAVFVEGQIGDMNLVTEVLKAFAVEAVMHFADSAEVAESTSNPGKFYSNNVSSTLRLLQAMNQESVRKIVFSSTAAVYGNPEALPITENQSCNPTNPYARSKWMSELMLQDFCTAHQFGYAILRYFNVAGAWPDGHLGEDHHPETHLIPRILAVARDGHDSVKIFGADYPTEDGTCLRDYTHVMDLVQAHILALETLRPGEGEIFNLGSESGFSVREVIEVCEKVTGHELFVEEYPRRSGDAAALVASCEKIREKLGWERAYPKLEQIIQHAWLWHTQHPAGYESSLQNENSRLSHNSPMMN